MPVWALARHNGRMRAGLVEELEEFVRAGDIWDPVQLGALVAALETEGHDGDPIAGLLAHPLRSVGLRAEMGELPSRTARDIEGIVFPRLWKVMEAIRDDMPPGELRVRIEVFNRRLARCFAAERQAPRLAAP
jgi:hypothetical protein